MTGTVIVAHGLWLPGAETRLLRHRLQAAGFRPCLFRFSTVRASLSENIGRLHAFTARTRADVLHFVGYSLGGVVTLAMLRQTHPERVGRIVCLGSPLTGSRVAAMLARTGFGRALVGKSLAEHAESGGFESWDLPYDLGIIAGTRSLGFGRFVQSFPGANDGTVAVDETRLPGARAHISLPVTHTQLLFDRAVARQTIHFLRAGGFG